MYVQRARVLGNSAAVLSGPGVGSLCFDRISRGRFVALSPTGPQPLLINEAAALEMPMEEAFGFDPISDERRLLRQLQEYQTICVRWKNDPGAGVESLLGAVLVPGDIAPLGTDQHSVEFDMLAPLAAVLAAQEDYPLALSPDEKVVCIYQTSASRGWAILGSALLGGTESLAKGSLTLVHSESAQVTGEISLYLRVRSSSSTRKQLVFEEVEVGKAFVSC